MRMQLARTRLPCYQVTRKRSFRIVSAWPDQVILGSTIFLPSSIEPIPTTATLSPSSKSNLPMSPPNTIQLSNGQILTGRLWRNQHPFFKNLPFFSDIPRKDEMAGPLEAAFNDDGKSYYKELLVVSVFASCCPLKSNSFNRNLPRV